MTIGRFEMLKAIEKWYWNIQKTKEFELGTDNEAYNEIKALINSYAPGEGCLRLPNVVKPITWLDSLPLISAIYMPRQPLPGILDFGQDGVIVFLFGQI